MAAAGLSPHPGTVLGIETDPSDPGLRLEKLNQISSLMTFANISAVGWLLRAPRPPHGPLGLGLMNDLGRLGQQRPSVKPEALEGSRSLINIDLALREAAYRRTDPGHPRRGLIKSGSTARPGRRGEAGSGVPLSKRPPRAWWAPAS